LHYGVARSAQLVAAIAELVAAFALMTPAVETFTASKKPEVVGKWQSVQPRPQTGPSPGP